MTIPRTRYSANTLQCYLQIVVQLSLVFNTPLARADAADILFPQQNHGSALELFDRQLLIAWLSFADGAIGLGDPVDTNGDGVIDTTFGAVLLAAETVRLSPTSTRHQILEQRNVLGRVLGVHRARESWIGDSHSLPADRLRQGYGESRRSASRERGSRKPHRP